MSLEKLIAMAAPAEWLQHETAPPAKSAELGTPANIAAGTAAPTLDPACHAMLIMSGCTARFVGYYWMVEHRKTGKRTNISLLNSPMEWQAALSAIGDMQYGPVNHGVPA